MNNNEEGQEENQPQPTNDRRSRSRGKAAPVFRHEPNHVNPNLAPQGPTWDELDKELEELAGSEASLSEFKDREAELSDLYRAVVASTSRRLCELGSMVFASGVSANVMTCHSNDPRAGVMQLRVFESFPHYSIDRTVRVQNGRWTLNVRTVNYLHPEKNDHAVADALVSGVMKSRSVDPRSNAPGEAQLREVYSLLPAQLRAEGQSTRGDEALKRLEKVRPGSVVALNLDFYSTAGRSEILTAIQRYEKIKQHLSWLHDISLVQSIPAEARTRAMGALLKQQPVSRLSWVEVAHAIVRIALKTVAG